MIRSARRCAPTPRPGKFFGHVVTMRQVMLPCATAGAARVEAAAPAPSVPAARMNDRRSKVNLPKYEPLGARQARFTKFRISCYFNDLGKSMQHRIRPTRNSCVNSEGCLFQFGQEEHRHVQRRIQVAQGGADHRAYPPVPGRSARVWARTRSARNSSMKVVSRASAGDTGTDAERYMCPIDAGLFRRKTRRRKTRLTA